MATLRTRRSERASAALAGVEANCAARGVRLTPGRRSVLGLLLRAERPLGAYGLMERLRAATRRPVAPPTVYRALDFLVRQGFVHRVERLDAFAVCSAVAAGGDAHAHAPQFLICRRCGAALELHDPSVGRALARAAARTGFAAGHAVVEVEGLCARCAALPRARRRRATTSPDAPAPALTRRSRLARTSAML